MILTCLIIELYRTNVIIIGIPEDKKSTSNNQINSVALRKAKLAIS